jgi:2',3'-cyclic-nucleotide 2'-phosphodiesterase (5'-nucleotidase family)
MHVTLRKEVVSELHGQGVKVVIALTHLSMREDKEVARLLRRQCDHRRSRTHAASSRTPAMRRSSR